METNSQESSQIQQQKILANSDSQKKALKRVKQNSNNLSMEDSQNSQKRLNKHSINLNMETFNNKNVTRLSKNDHDQFNIQVTVEYMKRSNQKIQKSLQKNSVDFERDARENESSLLKNRFKRFMKDQREKLSIKKHHESKLNQTQMDPPKENNENLYENDFLPPPEKTELQGSPNQPNSILMEQNFYNDEQHKQQIRRLMKERKQRQKNRLEAAMKIKDQFQQEEHLQREQQEKQIQRERLSQIERIKKNLEQRRKRAQLEEKNSKDVEQFYQEKLGIQVSIAELHRDVPQLKDLEEKKQYLSNLRQLNRPLHSPQSNHHNNNIYNSNHSINRSGLESPIAGTIQPNNRKTRQGGRNPQNSREQIDENRIASRYNLQRRSVDKSNIQSPSEEDRENKMPAVAISEKQYYKPKIWYILQQEQSRKELEEFEKQTLKNKICERRRKYADIVKNIHKPVVDPSKELEMKILIEKDLERGRGMVRATIFDIELQQKSKENSQDTERAKSKGNQYLNFAKSKGKTIKPHTQNGSEDSSVVSQRGSTLTTRKTSLHMINEDDTIGDHLKHRQHSTSLVNDQQLEKELLAVRAPGQIYSQAEGRQLKAKHDYLPELHQKFGDLQLNQIYIRKLEKSVLRNDIDIRDQIDRIKNETQQIEAKAGRKEKLLEINYDDDNERQQVADLYLASIKAQLSILDSENNNDTK